VPAVAATRQSSGSYERTKNGGKKGWNELHSRDFDVHEEDVKEVSECDKWCHSNSAVQEIFCAQNFAISTICQVMGALISKALHALHGDLQETVDAATPLVVSTAANESVNPAFNVFALAADDEAIAQANSTTCDDIKDEMTSRQDQNIMLDIACSIRNHPLHGYSIFYFDNSCCELFNSFADSSMRRQQRCCHIAHCAPVARIRLHATGVKPAAF
jgi:hypothetical protein